MKQGEMKMQKEIPVFISILSNNKIIINKAK
jgi:hypothetical protein